MTGLLGLAILAAACAGNGGDESTEPGAGTSLLPAEPLELPTFDFSTFQDLLAELRGTPVVVNVWASWCGPCRAEAPHLAEAHGRYGGRVQFLGVDILDNRADARAFMKEFGWEYPSLFDPDGEIRDKLGFFGQPITVFYDAQGEMVDSWIGPIGKDELTERIENLLATK